MRRPVVLIADDEEAVRKMLKILLEEDYETITARDGAEAVEIVRSTPVDMALIDLNMPRIDGLEALGLIKGMEGETGVFMISGEDSAQQAVRALKMGAYDYITKPFDNDDLLSTLGRYTDSLNLRSEVEFLKEELRTRSGYGDIIAESPAMKRVFEFIHSLGRTSSSVLITGESGTGKELVARAIHATGERKNRPFVAINCGAVPAELMESELFGHERGAFTGAHARKIGKFEYADGGTVFLDEVSTLPAPLQVKLLRALQERSFERIGGNVQIKVDIRIISATNTDLAKAVAAGTFREDLYYRLKVVPIELPPLRERKSDIGLLVEHFLAKHSRNCKKNIPGIAPGVIDAFMEYSWPGNVRELENFIERLVVLANDGEEIVADDIPVGMFTSPHGGALAAEAGDFREACRLFERGYIIAALNREDWNRTRTARRMKIHRNTLLLKMKALGIKAPPGRRPSR